MKLSIKTAADLAAEARSEALSQLANIRWQHETGGLTLPDGTLVRTDERTRASITEAVNALRANLMTGPIPWKMESGFVDLDQVTLEQIASLVAAHLKTSFAAERVVTEQIAALDNVAGYDVQAAYESALSALSGGA